ncbi:LANO_0F16622g1_1 [Lachancea nothofagi CBS 11611]|uniref:LANO_0F16622g1_1 n=1 Tax=Lachancea nothofagi CBS 11611 TaxID=1266666 RepID=A0A1G4KCX2_9SACH|nr:LANO_0F16622g1_1 [Lachancea nothofagi CBS 11611]
MNLSRASGTRIKGLSQVRFYRKRLKSRSSHVSQVNRHQNDLFLPQEYKLRAESAETVEKDLKRLGFKSLQEAGSVDDLFVDYLDSSSSPFKKASSEFSTLKSTLANVESLDSSNRMKALFEYLIAESEREVRRLESMGPEQIQKMHKRSQAHEDFEGDRGEINSEKELERAIMRDVQNAARSQDTEVLLPNTERMFRILSDLNMRKLAGANIISVENMVASFELAKIIPIHSFRQRGILLSGHLIYSLGNVRMDPVNESFYIESLVYYGFYKKALALFNSNRQKVNQRWWYEMGMMVCLRANHLAQFDNLLQYTLEAFGPDYLAPKVLRTAIRKKLYVRDFVGSEKLTNLFLKTVAANGWRPSTFEERRNSQEIFFDDQKQADQFLNQKEHATEMDFVALIQYHLFRKQKDKALKIFSQLLSSPNIERELLTTVLIKLKFHLLKSFDILKNDLLSYLSNNADNYIRLAEESFNKAAHQSSVEKLREKYENIFFDDITAIASKPWVAQNVENFVINSLPQSNSCKGVDSSRSSSMQTQNVLKSLLNNDKELQALKLLETLESLPPDREESAAFVKKANAHHYNVFVEYYSKKAQRTQNPKDRSKYEKKIEEVVTRVNEQNVRYNSTLLSSLLQHYRTKVDLDNCFIIINQVLNVKDVEVSTESPFKNLMSFFERREITKSLYYQIWKTFALYYSFFDNGLGTTELRSNYRAWKRNVLKERSKINVHPSCNYRELFEEMVLKDNVLPDAQFYETIIRALVHVREWSYIPAVIKYMSQINGIRVDKKLLRYINGGLRLEYIAIEREKLRDGGCTVHEFTTPIINSARRVVENKIKSGEILNESNTDRDFQITKNILGFLEEIRPDELLQVQTALEQLDLH